MNSVPVDKGRQRLYNEHGDPGGWPGEVDVLLGKAVAGRYGACMTRVYYLEHEDNGRPFGIAARVMMKAERPSGVFAERAGLDGAPAVKLWPWCVILLDTGDKSPFWTEAEAGAVEQVINSAYEAAGSVEGVAK